MRQQSAQSERFLLSFLRISRKFSAHYAVCLLSLFFFPGVTLLFLGCGFSRKTGAVFFHQKSPSGTTTTQTGVAEIPAKVSEATQETSLIVPPGRVLIAIESTEPTPLTVKTEASTIVAPAMIHDKPASPKEVAEGKSVWVFRVVSAIMVILGVVAIATEHAKAGVILIIGAIATFAVEKFGELIQSAIGGVFLIVAFTLVVAWWLLKRRFPTLGLP